MVLTNITFTNFRSFEEKQFHISPYLTIIISENAKGKTNALEGIYVCINGSGFREHKEEELIRIGENECLIQGAFREDEKNMEFSVFIRKSNTGIEKSYRVNKAKQKYYQYIMSQTKAILFSPEQINIITGAPDNRREYLNIVIAYDDLEYKKKLANYDHALRRRNKIFEYTRDVKVLKEELMFWNIYCIEQAVYITKRREEYINYLNNHASLNSKRFKVKYVKNVVTKERFDEVFEEERRYRRTVIGPQKDDFQIFLVNAYDKNIHHFGSRSEQRLTIFWLKINEITQYEEKYGKKPILLLDDVFSELDTRNKKLVLDLIKGYQTVITTTEEELMKLVKEKKMIIEL